MRVIDKNRKTITKYDLSVGRLIPVRTVKEDATPIDNIKKFAWAEEDYEDALVYVPYREVSPKKKIASLKKKLAATDDKVIECSECQILGKEIPYDITELHAERQKIREEINKLEA